MTRKRTPRILKVAIIGCGPESQEPMTYMGAKWTIRELLGRKMTDLARKKGLRIKPQVYWPAGNPRDYPCHGTYDAVVIPGSKLNIDQQGLEDNPWMGGLLDFIRETDSHVPMLGICFGHQALAAAHGGRVERIPEALGPEVGFSPVFMTEDAENDALFRDLPKKFEGLFSHFTYVSTKPKNSKVLARGVMPDMIQAFRLGQSAWGVQFHPDYSPHNIGELVEFRKERLAQMLDISQIKTINPDRQDHKVLENFIDHSFGLRPC